MKDVVIYGGTAAGIVAGIQAARMNKSVVVVEPGMHIGGLTTGGLGQTDIGNKAAIGGLSREFYRRIKRHYADPANWKWQKPGKDKADEENQTRHDEDAMWTFEPSAALKILKDMLDDAGIAVVRGERLDRQMGVKMDGPRIVSITMESGTTIHGRMFIDATYEGDLMAAAGVRFHVGREAGTVYGENLNGVRTANATFHQFKRGVSPYVIRDDPGSGLLPGIDAFGPGAEGSGDKRVQAYCFRMCLTDHPDNRIAFHKPENYDERNYELLFRNFEAGETGFPWINSHMPNRKTDTNNRLGFSTDFIGQNYAYPEATYKERTGIVQKHLEYQQGLMWTLANHDRIPKQISSEVRRWGTCRDEFTDNGGWQSQLYIREARRMVGDRVMAQRHCQGEVVAEDPVGLAAYTMDSHHVQRYVDAEGCVCNEGDVEIGGFPPYPVSYRSIVPRESECTNLAVPVCLSASHIAYGSIRMEPVFMVLGQSAAAAACHAIDEETSLQNIDYRRLRKKLLADGQKLEWQA